MYQFFSIQTVATINTSSLQLWQMKLCFPNVCLWQGNTGISIDIDGQWCKCTSSDDATKLTKPLNQRNNLIIYANQLSKLIVQNYSAEE